MINLLKKRLFLVYYHIYIQPFFLLFSWLSILTCLLYRYVIQKLGKYFSKRFSTGKKFQSTWFHRSVIFDKTLASGKQAGNEIANYFSTLFAPSWIWCHITSEKVLSCFSTSEARIHASSFDNFSAHSSSSFCFGRTEQETPDEKKDKEQT